MFGEIDEFERDLIIQAIIDTAFTAKVRNVNNLAIINFGGQDKTHETAGDQKTFYPTMGAGQKMVAFGHLDSAATLRTFLFKYQFHGP